VRQVGPVTNAPHLEMQMNEAGRAGITDEAKHLAGLEPRAHRGRSEQARCEGIEMGEEHDVVTQGACLANRVARDHRRAKKRPHVDDFSVLFLVLESHQGHRCSARRGQVDAAVPHMPQMSPAALQLIGTVQVVPTEDTPGAARNGVLVGVIVGGSIGPAGDLVVDHPVPARIAVGAGGALGSRSAFVVVGQMHAGTVVGQSIGGAGRGRERVRDRPMVQSDRTDRYILRGGTASRAARTERRERAEQKSERQSPRHVEHVENVG